MEKWKDIKGYEGFYQCSTLGRVRSLDRIVERKLPNAKTRICKQKGRIIAQMINKGTRKGVLPRYELRLSKDGKTKGFQVHRLIAATFLGDITNKEVNHKDGNPLNNKISNLELVKRIDNINHAFDNKLINTSFSVLKYKDGKLINKYRSLTKASEDKDLNLCQSTLSQRFKKCNSFERNGFSWKVKRPVETIENTTKSRK